MTNQEKNIPNLITSSEYLEKLFNAHIKDIDRGGVKVLNITSYKIKKYFDDHFFHFVIQNNVVVQLKNGLRKRFKIFCVAFSGHKRRSMYQILGLIYHQGFDKGNIIIPKPLWYINELMSAFYIGVPGDNFLEHIKNGHVDQNITKKIAKGLFKLHHAKGVHDLKLLKHSFSYEFLDPTNVLKRFYNINTSLTKDIKQQFKKLKNLQRQIIDDKYCLSHGDFHPENVIINKFKIQQVAIIDFSEGCLAPEYFDIASFLQQLEFMTRSYLTLKQYQKLEEIFLASYFNEVIIDSTIQNKLNLYKSWTALKSAVYFTIFEDEVNRDFAKYLLRKSRDIISV